MSRSPDQALRASDAGFTLVEVLVSLGVVGAVVAALVQAVAGNALRARQVDSRVALIAAERSLMEALPARGELREGSSRGRVNGVDWRMRIIALPPPPMDEQRPLAWTAFRINVDFETPDGLTSRVETIRLGRTPS